jgi:hypothetical protein
MSDDNGDDSGLGWAVMVGAAVMVLLSLAGVGFFALRWFSR